MKILLIEPPFARFMGFYRFFFPFALSSLSAYLKRQGHEVLIYDAEHGGQPVDMNSTDLLNVFPRYLAGIRDPEAAGMQPIQGASPGPVFRSEEGGRVMRKRDHVLLGQERRDVGRPNDLG